jgi:hypothetical protein
MREGAHEKWRKKHEKIYRPVAGAKSGAARFRRNRGCPTGGTAGKLARCALP